MSTYSIKLLTDNAEICRTPPRHIHRLHRRGPDDTGESTVHAVLEINIIQTDTLTMTIPSGEPLIFAE